jgi:hypothetical protein
MGESDAERPSTNKVNVLAPLVVHVERRPGWWPWRYEVWCNHLFFDGFHYSWGVEHRYLRRAAALARRDYLLGRTVVRTDEEG